MTGQSRNRAAASLLIAAGFIGLSTARADFQRGADGWTVLEPSPDSRVVYVSSSMGDDANDGLSPDSPLQSVAQGKSLIRDNSNDFLLFKRGDEWNEGFGDLFAGGISAEQPLVISAYGEGPRPLFNTGSSHGVTMWSQSYANAHGGGYNNIVFRGLHLRPAAYTGAQPGDNPAGFRIDRPGANLLFEDMHIEGYATNIVVQSVDGSHFGTNIQVRRSIVVDAYALRGENGRPWDLPGGGTGTDNGYPDGSHAQGLYASRIDGLLIEENVFDHNGWREEVPGGERTIYNHNLYIQRTNTTEVTVRGNILANGAAHAAQLRNGGVLEDNLFVGNGTGAFIHREDVDAHGRAERNVFLHSSSDDQYALGDVDHGGTGPRNGGLEMGNEADFVANDNLFLHTANGNSALRGTSGVGTEGNLTYEWGSTQLDYDGQVYSPPFPDPDRDVASYDLSIGGDGSIESFLAGARQLSRDNWNTDYLARTANAYFFEGFGLSLDAALEGDYSGDGVVNAADYIVWRNSLGDSGPGLPADGNGDMTIDQDDFEYWKQRFGNVAADSSAMSPVPEPASGWVVVWWLAFVCQSRPEADRVAARWGSLGCRAPQPHMPSKAPPGN